MCKVTSADSVAKGTGPVASNARIVTLDVLRGFALLGMIIAHFHKTMAAATAPGVTSWIGTFITMAVAEKDRTVFAFLFGVGFAIMMRRLEVRGLSVAVIFLRRLFVLYLVGFAVEALTRFSILREYAWWGVPLLFLRNFPTRPLLALALISTAALSIRDLVDDGYAIATLGRQDAIATENARLQQWETNQRPILEALKGGKYPKVVSTRIGQMVRELPTFYNFTPKVYLALFILGLLSMRHGIFDDPKRRLHLIVGAMVAGLLIWAAYWWVLPLVPTEFVTPRIAMRFHSGFGIVDEQFLAFTYIGMITLLLAYRPDWQTRLSSFGWVGRMALTNYIMQAAAIDFLSSPYGLGLKVGPKTELAAAAALFGLQVLLSRLWLSRFRFGPFEWMWRSLTYWQWQPLRNTSGHERSGSRVLLPP